MFLNKEDLQRAKESTFNLKKPLAQEPTVIDPHLEVEKNLALQPSIFLETY